jgi:hypothetical protein
MNSENMGNEPLFCFFNEEKYTFPKKDFILSNNDFYPPVTGFGDLVFGRHQGFCLAKI